MFCDPEPIRFFLDILDLEFLVDELWPHTGDFKIFSVSGQIAGVENQREDFFCENFSFFAFENLFASDFMFDVTEAAQFGVFSCGVL